MKIVITGARGFIGTELCRQLIQSNIQFFAPNRHEIISYIKVTKPDVIFHLAANPLIKTSDVQSLYDSNVQLTKSVLDACPKDCHIIFSSSAAVYGDLGEKSEAFEDSPTIPTSIYGETKLISESLINMYTLSGKIRSTILRLVANVGPNPTHGVLKDLVYKYNNNDTLELLGDCPGSSKPYINVYDTASAMTFVMNRKLYGTYNVSTTEQLSVLDIANIIESYYKRNKEKIWLGADANWKGDNKVVRVNSDKLFKAGFNRKYTTSKQAVYAAISEQ